MKRISISFYDDIYKKLDERKKEEGLSSVAQCVRELVDLGLKIESASKENEPKNNESDQLLEIKSLLKNGLIWSLEARLLARYLVEKQAYKNDEDVKETLEKYKLSSLNYVQGLYNEKIE